MQVQHFLVLCEHLLGSGRLACYLREDPCVLAYQVAAARVALTSLHREDYRR